MEENFANLKNFSLSEQNIDVGDDLFEQQQALEQARLFNRFQQLRQWQARQQEQLMLQQQQQLLSLQSEQQLIQSLIAKQRLNPCDQTASNNELYAWNSNGGVDQERNSVPFAPNLYNSSNGKQNVEAISPSFVIQKGRPKPNIPVEMIASQFNNGDISCVDSESNTLESRSVEDGIFPLSESDGDDGEPVSKATNQPIHSQPISRVLNRSTEACSTSTQHKSGSNHLRDTLKNTISDQVVDSKRNVANISKISEEVARRSPVAILATDMDRNNFDEIPVSGILTKKKTFEELVEEELQRENQLLKQNVNNPQQQKCSFLKKGEGIARFDNRGSSSTARCGRVSLGTASQKQSAELKSTTQKVKPKNFTTQPTEPKNFTIQPTEPKNFTTQPPEPKNFTAQPTEPKNMTAAQPVNSKDLKTQSVNPRKLTDSSKLLVKHQIPQLTLKSSKLRSEPNELNNRPNKDVVMPMNERTARASSNSNKIMDVELETKGDNLGDASFHNCMQSLQKQEEVEINELEEFEILEQYAQDNASFLSNLSSVKRVLDQQKRKIRTDIPSNGTVMPDSEDTNFSELSSGSLHSDDCEDCSESSSFNLDDGDCSENDNINPDPDSTLVKGKWLQDGGNKLFEMRPDNSSLSYRKIVSLHTEHQTRRFSSENDIESSGNESEEDSPAEADVSSNHLQTKIDDKDWMNNSIEDNKCQNLIKVKDDVVVATKTLTVDRMGSNNFQDDEAWEETKACKQSNQLKPTSNDVQDSLKISKGDVRGEDEAPPTSRLVSQFFPKLNNQQKPASVKHQEQQKLSDIKEIKVGDGVQSKVLHERLMELEREIQKYRDENNALSKLRKEKEEGLEKFKKEVSEFEKQKKEELDMLLAFKNEEMKNLKKERRIFERYQKAARAVPDKKERDEIEALKSQLNKLQVYVQSKEQRWSANTKRLRDRIEQLEYENVELKQEIHLLEQKIFEGRKSKKVDANSDVIKSSSAPNVANYETKILQNDQPRSVRISAADSQHPVGQPSRIPVSTADSINPVARLGSSNTQLLPSNDHNNELQNCILSRKINVIPTEPTHAPPFVPVKKTDIPSPGIKNDSGRHTSDGTMRCLLNEIDRGDEVFEEIEHVDGKTERLYLNGMREILFTNGTCKQVSSDGQTVIVSFFNGDVKQMFPDHRVVYYYADAKTTHTTFPDGLEILQFPNKQIEKHYPDGTKEITFPDQTIKYLFPNGLEENVFPDGTIIRIEKNGDKVMEFPNGQREIHNVHYKRREYPDGTVKTVYPNGQQETRYSSGRTRIKDKDGNVIVDNEP